MNDSTDRSSEIHDRLDRLETDLARFQHEISQLRAMLSAREEAPTAPEPKTTPPLPPEPVPASPLPEPEIEASEAVVQAFPEPPPPARTTVDIEALLSGRVLAWIGGLAVLVGSLFFLSLAFSRGWIGPETRVVIGLIAGAAMVTGGAFFFERRERLFGHTLLAVGLGVFNLALFAATTLYDLIAFELALAGTFVGAAVGAIIAIRSRSQVVAAYGLLPALAGPVLFDADTSGLTIAYLAILLIGTAAISLYRTWTWLPLLSLIFTFPQLYAWLADSPPALVGVLVLAGYWLVHALASGGEDIRVLRTRLRVSSSIVMVLNTVIAGGGGMILLDGTLEEWRGLYLFGLAALHLPIAGLLFYRSTDRHAFGMLSLGLSLTAAAIAIPVQFSGEVVPVAWASLAVVMIWIYGRLNNPFSLLAGLGYGGLALWHFVFFDYPLDDFFADLARSGYPFINWSGFVLGGLLLATAAAGYLTRRAEARPIAILLGAGLISYALPYEITGGWLIACWALIALALALANRAEPTGHPVYAVAGLGLTGFTLLITLAQVATPSRLRVDSTSVIDHLFLWSDASLALGSLAIALAVGWYIHRREFPLIAGFVLAAAVSLVVYLLSIGLVDEFQKRVDVEDRDLGSLREQAQVGLSILWTTFGVASFVLGVIIRRIGMRIYGLALLGIAIVKVFIVDLASLDASYRVISFIALGILLLLASYLYQRLIAQPNEDVSASASA